MIESQAALEEMMYSQGKVRAEANMLRNEEQGRASMNPYGQAILRRFVLPLADKITEDLEARGAGMRQAHVILLKPLDPDTVAYIAVRTTLTYLMNVRSQEQAVRGLMLEVHRSGRSVVWTGDRERAETYVQALQGYHLLTSLEPAFD